MLTLPIYCRNGTYYLHTRVGNVQFKRSLKTRNPEAAKLIALELLRVVFMAGPKISDFNFDGVAIKKYEVEMDGIRIKADNQADHQRALEAIAAMKNIAVNTTFVEPLAPSATALTLFELLDKYLLMKTLAAGSAVAVKNSVKEFAKFVGEKTRIDKVLTADARNFGEHLKRKGNALQTVNNKFNLLKAVFNYAKQASYLRTENPFQLKIMTKTQKLKAAYEIFDDEDIEKIYTQEYLLLEKNRDPDYFWVLILAVVTGLRVGTLTNLTTNDVKKTDMGTYFFRIRDDKTMSGKRDVPVISEIFEMGFADFILHKSAIFKYQERDGKGKGNAVGKKFTRRLLELGLKERKLVFHSLRKYANDFYQKNGVTLEARCQFFGHEIDNTNTDFYTKNYTVDQIFEIVKLSQTKILTKISKLSLV
jgi:integrase